MRIANIRTLGLFFFFTLHLGTALWVSLDRVFILWALFLGLFLFYWLKHGPLDPIKIDFPKMPPNSIWVKIFLVLAVLPVAVFLGFTWQQEFPFSGDHYHHLLAQGEAAYFWKKHIFWVPAALLIFYLIKKHLKIRYLPLVMLAAFFGWSYFAEHHLFLARFPALGYFLNLPFYVLGKLFQTQHPLNPMRLSSALSIVAWLLVLRPLFCRRWPDLRSFFVALFFLWNATHVYLFSTNYLEPWAIIFSLVGLELALTAIGPQQLLAPFFVATASLCKENAILLLPFVFLAMKNWKQALLPTFFAALPFGTYLLVRRSYSIFRGVDGLSLSQAFTHGRWKIWWHRLVEQFPGIFGLSFLPITLLVLFLVFVCWWGARNQKRHLFLIVGFFGQLLFYFLDQVSAPWTGYPRFHVFAFALLSSALFALPSFLDQFSKKHRTIAIAAIALLGLFINGPGLFSLFKRARGSSLAMNGFLHKDDPQYFPVRELLAGIPSERVTWPRPKVVLLPPLGDAMERAYPDLNRKYEFIYPLKRGMKPPCECTQEYSVVFLPRFQNVKERPQYLECLKKLQQSCARWVRPKDPQDSSIVAIQ